MNPNQCATVAIKGEPTEGNPSGIVVINESDFDAATMELAEVPEPAKEPVLEPVAPVDPNAPVKSVVAPWQTT